MNIWYISKYLTLPHERVGGRSFLLLREFVRNGNQVLAFTSDSNHLVEAPKFAGRYHELNIEGVLLCWIKTLKYKGAKSTGRIMSWLSFEWALWRTIRKRNPKPDVVIASSLSLLSIINGLILKRRFNCPLIFEVRDIWPLTITEEGGFNPRNPAVKILAAIERLAYRKSDAIVGTMPNLAEHVSEVTGDQSAPVFCIPMGFDEGLLSNSEPLPPIYIESNVPDDKFIIGYVGTIGITNALQTLVDCARRMKSNTDLHFLIIGDGDLKEGLQKQTADLNNITFAPAIPKQQVQAALALCDLLYFSVHPSKVWQFGQSLNKVIDYMLAGKPIVASYDGFPSMINEAESGIFVEAGSVDALETAISSYANLTVGEREKTGRRARKWLLQHRNYATLADEYLSMIHSLIAISSAKNKAVETNL